MHSILGMVSDCGVVKGCNWVTDLRQGCENVVEGITCVCPECRVLLTVRVRPFAWTRKEYFGGCGICGKVWYWRIPRRWIAQRALVTPWTLELLYVRTHRVLKGVFYVHGGWDSWTGSGEYMVFDLETQDSWRNPVDHWTRQRWGVELGLIRAGAYFTDTR